MTYSEGWKDHHLDWAYQAPGFFPFRLRRGSLDSWPRPPLFEAKMERFAWLLAFGCESIKLFHVYAYLWDGFHRSESFCVSEGILQPISYSELKMQTQGRTVVQTIHRKTYLGMMYMRDYRRLPQSGACALLTCIWQEAAQASRCRLLLPL